MKKYLHTSILLLLLTTLTGCVKETPVNKDYETNFKALWTIINERYCFLDEKEVDWDQEYRVYAKWLADNKGKLNDLLFFNNMNAMLRQLKDGHVNLVSSFNSGRYHDWMGDPTEGNNIYIRDKYYLGQNYFSSGGMKFSLIAVEGDKENPVGYISYPSFSNSIGDMKFFFDLMNYAKCRALILDIRGNGGGLVDNADKLVSYFIDKKQLVGYTQYKTGPGRKDFSELTPQYITPNEEARWTDKPVVILQDRGCYSAANDFLYKVRVATNVTRIGLPSGGGGGMPAVSELPNGWRVRYSAVRSFDLNKVSVEQGIDPDIYQANESYYEQPAAKDRIMQKAMEHLGLIKPTTSN